MRALALLALAALLAGCSSPSATPTPSDGVIAIADKTGLVVLDLADGLMVGLTDRPGLGWISPSGGVLSWLDEGFAVVVDGAADARAVGPAVPWTRVYDNATGLELAPGEARWRVLRNGTTLATAPLPAAPSPAAPWTTASDDLAVLGAEYAGEGRGACAHDLFLHGATSVRTRGCHLSIAGDGRAGWTEGGGVRVMDADGTIRNVTGPSSGDASQNAFVAHENPVFTRDGMLYLRLTGGASVAKTEVLGEEGTTTLARLDGPKRLALLGATDDGQQILVRVFER